MGKEVEALRRIETTFSLNKQGKESAYRAYTNSMYPYYEDFDLVLKALNRLEAIDNANPSESIKCLDQFINEMTRCLENPKQYAKNYDKEIFYKYKYTFETTIKQALLKAQEPKQYLKWEDLEFDGNNEYSYFKVKLGDNVYTAFSYFSYVFNKDTVVIKTYNQIAITEDNKQFFNDLHLERVKE